MRSLSIAPSPAARLRVLCLGAHADDIEIGCGATLIRLMRGAGRIDVEWVVFSAPRERAKEARRSAALFLDGARSSRVVLHRFRDGFFPYQGAAIKRVFEGLKRRPSPDLVLTHYRDDRHQDHRLLSDLTWNTFRDHWILEYEIPKFDGDLGSPNCFVPLDKRTCARKIAHLHDAFASQRGKHWFAEDTFMALMRLRGMECRAAGGYAEAFYSRKITVSL